MSSIPVVLVTGGSSGLGKSMCHTLAKHGYRVYGTSRKCSTETLMDGFTLIPLDVTDAESVQKAVHWIQSKEGRLDVLINNAGISGMGPLEEVPMDEIKSIFETNVFGLIRVTQAALPLLRSSRGRVINISSLAGEIALPYRSVYCASKFAVEAVTESLSLELSPFGVSVALIQPGDLNTEINQNRKVTMVKPDSVYESSFRMNLKSLEKEMGESMDPSVMGGLILEILSKDRPRLRYRVGSFVQKLTPVLKKLLPARWFESLLKRHYHLK